MTISGGTATVSGCYFDATPDESKAAQALTKGISLKESAVVTIENTTIVGVTCASADWASAGVEVATNVTATVTGCNITTNTSGQVYGVAVQGGQLGMTNTQRTAEVTISNSTITANE